VSDLAEQAQFSAEIQEGMRLLSLRRSQLAHEMSARPAHIAACLPVVAQSLKSANPAPITQAPESKQSHSQVLAVNLDVKIWPVVGLAAALSAHGGAWRLWVLARALDEPGAGRVSAQALAEFTKQLHVGARNYQRWRADALRLGLLRYAGTDFYYCSLGVAAVLLGAERVGQPAMVSADKLVRSGWRAVVWSAYLVTLGERPISQAIKCQLTGIDERTQRNYQAAQPGSARPNYALTTMRSDALTGAREHLGGVYFQTSSGRIIQRLPDARIVPIFIAQAAAHRGRSKKAQRTVNLLCSVAQEQSEALYKLFCANDKQVCSDMRQNLPLSCGLSYLLHLCEVCLVV
jgi:hypothetical protein